jgi:hypothetical protein
MLIPRGGGRGTIQLGLLGRANGAFPDTGPGDVARGLAHERPLAGNWPGRAVAIALRGGLSAIPLMRRWRPPGGEVRAHG